MNSTNAALNRIKDCATEPDGRFLELAEALHNFPETFITEDGRQLRNATLSLGDRFMKATARR